MTITFNDLINLPALEGQNQPINSLCSGSANHIPEVMLDDCATDLCPRWWRYEPDPRVTIETIAYIHVDHRRFHRVCRVLFDKAVVMFIRNAGREGDDEWGRRILYPHIFEEMCEYLRNTYVNYEKSATTDIGSVHDDAIDFCEFYHQTHIWYDEDGELKVRNGD